MTESKTIEIQTVTIPLSAYEDLIKDQKILDALYAAGVDNWEWYDDAMSKIDSDD